VNLESVTEMARYLELQITSTICGTEDSQQVEPVESSPHIIHECSRLLSEAALRWNSQIVANFPARPRLDRLKSAWRTRLINKARPYYDVSDKTPIHQMDGSSLVQFLFPIRSSSIPRMRLQLLNERLESSVSAPESPGAHLIILVHGYQGSTYDVRVIRNQGTYRCIVNLLLLDE